LDCCDTGRCPRNIFEAFRHFFTSTHVRRTVHLEMFSPSSHKRSVFFQPSTQNEVPLSSNAPLIGILHLRCLLCMQNHEFSIHGKHANGGGEVVRVVHHPDSAVTTCTHQGQKPPFSGIRGKDRLKEALGQTVHHPDGPTGFQPSAPLNPAPSLNCQAITMPFFTTTVPVFPPISTSILKLYYGCERSWVRARTIVRIIQLYN
jgi:hypothetical protein